MKKQLIRVYHPHYLWEEVIYNMWGEDKNKTSAKRAALKIMKDTKLFSYYMECVVNEWKYSCEHNLTNTTQNRVAWLGQAAISYSLHVSADITKSCWRFLSENQQRNANKEAEKHINNWEKEYAKNNTR